MTPRHILLIDIDGLRPDVLRQALAEGSVPHIAGLFGGRELPRGLFMETAAPAPSITFCSQASLFTGAHPSQHGIPGNQYFDRFTPQQQPRHFAFDVGDTLAVDDAVMVFTHGLASQQLHVPTFYEKMAKQGWEAVVAGNMYAKGAQTWLKPDLSKLTRFIKGKNLFGMSSAEYDQHIVDDVLAYLAENPLPRILTVYFMGVDHDSHKYGPKAQSAALKVVDGLIGQLWAEIQRKAEGSVLVSLFSDHGQIEVLPDDQHSLKLGFPFDREMAVFFDALGLDVHDYPGEDPACDAVLALNGGSAAVYLHNKTGHWWDAPDFERDVLPIGKAFWEAHQTGKYAADLQNALAAVLVRQVDKDGWHGGYQALTPAGELVDLATWFASQPSGLYLDPVNRLANYTSPNTGDILLLSNYAEQYYFGGELTGMHGGLHPADSRATLVYGWVGVNGERWAEGRGRIEQAIAARCAAEGGRLPSVVDMLTGVESVLGN